MYLYIYIYIHIYIYIYICYCFHKILVSENDSDNCNKSSRSRTTGCCLFKKAQEGNNLIYWAISLDDSTKRHPVFVKWAYEQEPIRFASHDKVIWFNAQSTL